MNTPIRRIIDHALSLFLNVTAYDHIAHVGRL